MGGLRARLDRSQGPTHDVCPRGQPLGWRGVDLGHGPSADWPDAHGARPVPRPTNFVQKMARDDAAALRHRALLRLPDLVEQRRGAVQRCAPKLLVCHWRGLFHHLGGP